MCFTLQDTRRSQSTPLSVRLTCAFRHANKNVPRAAAVCCDGLKCSAATDHDQTIDGILEATTVYYCIEKYTKFQYNLGKLAQKITKNHQHFLTVR